MAVDLRQVGGPALRAWRGPWGAGGRGRAGEPRGPRAGGRVEQARGERRASGGGSRASEGEPGGAGGRAGPAGEAGGRGGRAGGGWRRAAGPTVRRARGPSDGGRRRCHQDTATPPRQANWRPGETPDRRPGGQSAGRLGEPVGEVAGERASWRAGRRRRAGGWAETRHARGGVAAICYKPMRRSVARRSAARAPGATRLSVG